MLLCCDPSCRTVWITYITLSVSVVAAGLRFQPVAFGFVPAVWVVEVILAGGLLSSNTHGDLGVLDEFWVEPTGRCEKHFCAASRLHGAGIILLIEIRARSLA